MENPLSIYDMLVGIDSFNAKPALGSRIFFIRFCLKDLPADDSFLDDLHTALDTAKGASGIINVFLI
jgi:hypothetical protein